MATALTSLVSTDDNLETFFLLWLDAAVSQTEENIDAQHQLRASINHLKTFEASDECEQHIRSIPKEDRIVLIVSGGLGQNTVPHIHQLRQVTAIYVYCMDQNKHKQWANQFSKVRGVHVELKTLIEQIRADQKKRAHNKVDESLAITMLNTNTGGEQSSSELNGQFIHSQLLIDVLVRMKPTPTDKNELIDVCKKEYKGNKSQLAVVREFKRSYSSDRALSWYSKETFLYRLLNKALRVENVDVLFLFRFFIRDIRQQIEEHRCTSPVRVYRSQLMSNEELQQFKDSIGQYISMKSFLSTSVDRQEALLFLYESELSDDLQRVLFKIDADPRLPGVKSFVNISSFSDFPEEQEVLMMLGSIFRVNNVDYSNDGIWIIRMSLCSDDDPSLSAVYEYMKNEYGSGDGKTNLLSFGRVLRHMRKLDEAEKYFRRLLSERPSNHRSIASCYHNLGMVAYDKGEYDWSLEWYHKSLQIKERTLKSDSPKLAHSYNSIGLVHHSKGDDKLALEMYNKALVVYTEAFGEDHVDIATCLMNMGNSYHRQEKYSEALEYYQKSLAIAQKHLPTHHYRHGQLHGNIGIVHRSLGQYELALEHCNMALKIYQKSRSSQHPSIASTLENIGRVSEDKGEPQQALLYFKQAAAIYRHTLSPTHPNVVDIDKRIRRVSSEMNEIEEISLL